MGLDKSDCTDPYDRAGTRRPLRCSRLPRASGRSEAGSQHDRLGMSASLVFGAILALVSLLGLSATFTKLITITRNKQKSKLGDGHFDMRRSRGDSVEESTADDGPVRRSPRSRSRSAGSGDRTPSPGGNLHETLFSHESSVTPQRGSPVKLRRSRNSDGLTRLKEVTITRDDLKQLAR